jgi:hypothetical protein
MYFMWSTMKMWREGHVTREKNIRKTFISHSYVFEETEAKIYMDYLHV